MKCLQLIENELLNFFVSGKKLNFSHNKFFRRRTMFDIIVERAELLKIYKLGLKNAKTEKSEECYIELIKNIDAEINAAADEHFANIMDPVEEIFRKYQHASAFLMYNSPRTSIHETFIEICKIIIPFLRENIHKLKAFRDEINKMQFNGLYLVLNLVELYRSINNADCRVLCARRVENCKEVRSIYTLRENGTLNKVKYISNNQISFDDTAKFVTEKFDRAK